MSTETKTGFRIEIHLVPNDGSDPLVISLDDDARFDETNEAKTIPSAESGFVGYEPGDRYVSVRGKVRA